jgi:hypothetical protein
LIAEQVIKSGVSGCFVECGVANGAMVAAMAYAIKKHGEAENRKIHLFDSFEGIPLAGIHDHDQPGIGHHVGDISLPIEKRLVSSGVSVGTAEQVKHNLAEWGLDGVDFIFHKGWFQHTMPVTLVSGIALLRLDGDLYESVECCLKWLYPSVVPGGVVLNDDYPLPGSRLAQDDYFRRNGVPIPQVDTGVDTGACHWMK